MATTPPTDWNQRYRDKDTPWDSGVPSAELIAVLNEAKIAPGTAVEMGCGTGTNSVHLAERGFTVTGLDFSPLALEQARRKAQRAAVDVAFLQADLTQEIELEIAADFVFDRGCYHCVRKIDTAGYFHLLRQIARPGTRMLLLTGNVNEPAETGPPKLREEELRAEFSPLFTIDQLRQFRFEDPTGQGPLGWSCLMTRK
jgi:methyl halide transferase